MSSDVLFDDAVVRKLKNTIALRTDAMISLYHVMSYTSYVYLKTWQQQMDRCSK